MEAIKLVELRESDWDLYKELERDIRSRPWGGESYENGGAAPIEADAGNSGDAGDAAGEDDE